MKSPYQRFCEWKGKYPERLKAHRKVFVEMRAGRIKREPCIVCGLKKTEVHHEDYSKPLEITWLCKRCHTDRHINLRSAEYTKKGLWKTAY